MNPKNNKGFVHIITGIVLLGLALALLKEIKSIELVDEDEYMDLQEKEKQLASCELRFKNKNAKKEAIVDKRVRSKQAELDMARQQLRKCRQWKGRKCKVRMQSIADAESIADRAKSNERMCKEDLLALRKERDRGPPWYYHAGAIAIFTLLGVGVGFVGGRKT